MTTASKRDLIDAMEEIIRRLKSLRSDFDMSNRDYSLACRLALRQLAMGREDDEE